MKRIALFVSILLSVLSVKASPVSRQEASALAAAFLKQAEVKAVPTAFEHLYIFNGDHGFVILAGDDSPPVVRQAVATLNYHCGVSVEMEYGPNDSQAYTDDVPGALATYFGYNPSMMLVSKADYSNSAWKNLLKREFDASRPVYYDGYGNAGFAFICDGYDASDYFHFNWGWGGSNDGYYAIGALNPYIYNLNFMDDDLSSGTFNYQVWCSLNGMECDESASCSISLGRVQFKGYGVEEDAAEVRIIPNPVKDQLHVESPAMIRRLEIISVNGVTVVNQTVDHYSVDCHLGAFAEGVYMLRLFSDEGVITKKIIVSE